MGLPAGSWAPMILKGGPHNGEIVKLACLGEDETFPCDYKVMPDGSVYMVEFTRQPCAWVKDEEGGYVGKYNAERSYEWGKHQAIFPKDKKGEIRIMMSSDQPGKFQLTVKDNGIGFPDELDFRNTETLGLQLVTDLVKQLKGTIQMSRDKGTTFLIRF